MFATGSELVDDATGPPSMSTPINANSGTDCIAWERELLRRERDILKHERQLLQRSQLMSTNVTETTQYLKEAGEMIPTFDPGNITTLSAEHWIRRVDSIADTYGWDPRTTLLQAALKLRGAARFWFDGCREYVEDWPTFREELEKSFPTTTDEADVHWALTKRQKRAGESYEGYFYEMVAIGRRGGLSDSALRKYIIAGIVDPDVRKVLALTRFNALQDVLVQLRTYEDTMRQSTRYGQNTSEPRGYNGNRNGHVSQNREQVQRRPQSDENALRPSTQSARTTNDMKCYNCNQNGHISRNCEQPQRRQRCFKCGKTGHIARDCTTPRDGVMQVRQITGIVRTQNANEYMKRIGILQENITGIIDLGSDCVTMKISTANRLKIEQESYHEPKTIRGFGQGFCRSVGATQTLMIIDDVRIMAEILIVPDEAQEDEIIVGRSALDRKGIRIVKEFGKLTIEQVRDEDKEPIGNGEAENDLPEGDIYSDTNLQAVKEKGAFKMQIIETQETDIMTSDLKEVPDEEINSDDTLPQWAREKLRLLIAKYRNCFAQNLKEIESSSVLLKRSTTDVKAKVQKSVNKNTKNTKKVQNAWSEEKFIGKSSKLKNKLKHEKWKETFQNEDRYSEEEEIQDMRKDNKSKDKHNKLRETIEKLKAKSEISKKYKSKDEKSKENRETWMDSAANKYSAAVKNKTNTKGNNAKRNKCEYDFEENCMQHIMNATAIPRANGQIERYNRTIFSAIRTMAEQENEWDGQIRAIQWALNNTKQKVTKVSPHEVLFSYTPRDVTRNKIVLTLQDDGSSEDDIPLEELRKRIRDRTAKDRQEQKKRYDKKRQTPTIYNEGDLVLIEREPYATGLSKKLAPKYRGPYQVERVLGNDRYLLQDIPGAERTQRKFSHVYATDRMKQWLRVEDESNEEDEDEDAFGTNEEEDEPLVCAEDGIRSGRAECKVVSEPQHEMARGATNGNGQRQQYDDRDTVNAAMLVKTF